MLGDESRSGEWVHFGDCRSASAGRPGLEPTGRVFVTTVLPLPVLTCYYGTPSPYTRAVVLLLIFMIYTDTRDKETTKPADNTHN